MKTSKILVAFISLLLITCCSDRNTKSKLLPTFNLSDLTKVSELKLSDLGIENVEYIPLETDNNALIPFIISVKSSEDSYYINTGRTILRFAHNGHFLVQIGKNGRGPNEYQFINDFDIDENNGQVYISSGFEDKFYIFSAIDGNFIKTIPSPNKTNKFRFVDNEILCYSMNTDGIIVNSFDLLDLEGTIVKSFPNKYPFKAQGIPKIFLHENLFYKFNKQLFTKEINSDTIYVFENKEFKPRMVFNQGERLMPSKARENSEMDYIAKNYYTQFDLFEFSDKVYFEFLIDDTFYSFIGNKNGGEQFFSKQKKGFINDIDGGSVLKFRSTIDDNTIISWINAIDLKQHIATSAFKNSTPKYPEKKKQLEKLANSLNENDNPVLMLVKLKEGV